MSQFTRSLVWFRRDLRDYDHAALYQALSQSEQVYCVFVFDRAILDQLKQRADRRVEFIWHAVQELKQALQQHGGDLIVRYGDAKEEIVNLAKQLQVQAILSNRDYEPTAISRDQWVADALESLGIAFEQFKDQVMFEQDEILSLQGKPYSVFTPYKNAVLKQLSDTITALPCR